MRQQEEGQKRTEDAQAAGHKERILAATNAIRATRGVGLDDGEDVRAHKGTDFPRGSGNGVVLPTDGSGAGFRGHETDVIAGTCFAKREEDAVDDDEAGDVGGRGQLGVAACHDKADNSLEEHTDCEGVARPDPITDEGAANGAGEIEDVDDGIPAEGFPNGG